MNDFERLLAFLKVAYHNMSTLHRHLTKDPAWFGNHAVIGEWYAAIGDQLDDLVEIGIAHGAKDPSIKEAVLEFGGEVLPAAEYDARTAMLRASDIMRKIIELMRAAEIPAAPHVANKLQEYEYGWDKIANYMIAQAVGSNTAPTANYDDED